ncbi:ATP-binding protein [Paraburkholderia phytofirmans]|uniref:AAA ATPase n=1 Tax=Paraburkholderia phytofirmans (strain DSM 17436 / LMG 22146 / PsJN) TaxID=398527 RepID=B2T7I0_PARPJ|nr:ATP-binding protein [Paraburkholderia phytofirmans]ACD18261.1 AAA ATPase [Paraburkholderia phytofirmans PsJN]
MSSISFEQALHGSPSEKGEYLKSLRFMHRNLTSVVDEVARHMIPGAGLSLTLVTGPSGVGKSTFAALEAETLLKLYDIEIRENPGVIPVVLNEVDAADGKDINWRLFYKRLSEDLHALSPELTGQNSTGEDLNALRSFRLTFEDALRFRKVRHLILDEAVHFTDSRTDPLLYGNLLKSLANRGGLNLLLVGAYGSEKLVRASGQLARRISVIRFDRYHDNQDDFDAFTQFIKAFEPHIPLPFKVDLKKYIERLFYAHLGMPGYAAKALIEAVTRCAAEGSTSWEDRYIWNALPTEAEHDTVGAETLEGEKNVKPYLSSEYPIAYPSEAEMLARLAARNMQSGGNSLRGLRQ